MINGYKLFYQDRNCHVGGISYYINENILSKTVNVEGIKKDCEIVQIEISTETRKQLCIGLYKPPSQKEKYFFDHLSFVINRLTCQYENFMLISGFSMTIKNKSLEVFMNLFGLECFIKKTKCFQSKNLSCIYLILRNKKYFFDNSNVLEAGIPDHDSFIITILKINQSKETPKQNYIVITLNLI